MKFACHHCRQHLDIDDTLAGHKLECPSCGTKLIIPAPSKHPTLVAMSRPVPGRVREPRATPAPVARPRMSRRRKILFGVGATAALFVLMAGGLWMVQGPAALETLGIARFIPFMDRPGLMELRVYPETIQLQTSTDRQSVTVQALYEDGVTRDVTRLAGLSIDNRSVSRFEEGVLMPVTDGATALQVSYRGLAREVSVTVTQADMARPLSFRLDVIPVFTKAGCNSGACHGSSRGKDGFRLSLFGYDPDGDYHRLTREVIGRRINLALPEESLVLEKGLGIVQHTGGTLFEKGDHLYQSIHQWLVAGAARDGTNVPDVVSLEIMPAQAVMEGEGSLQRLSVRATYSDGTDRDVTRMTVFHSNNDASAEVSKEGMVTAGTHGEAFITARFDSFTQGTQVLVIPEGVDAAWPDTPENNYIDTLVHKKLRQMRMLPSELCDDATYLRRIHLDIIGKLPSPDEVAAFLADPDTGKRERVIDELLMRPEFADLWVMKWAELLQIRSVNNRFSYKSSVQYFNWLRKQVLDNVPMDQIVRELVTASGSTFENPPANYYQLETDTLKTAENTAQIFMGMRIQCAQCHNHPFDRWTMRDYYSFAAFFSQIGRKGAEDPRERVIYNKSEGDVLHPVSKQIMSPRFLGGDLAPEDVDRDRREILATWLASPDNPWFARNLANMVWAHFMGRGIIEPVDDVRITNPPSNAELLDALAGRFTDYRYDFRKLVRDICSSRTYQLSTRANEGNQSDHRNFARASIRRLRAEVLLDCISQVTATEDKFKGLPQGSRAVQISDGNTGNFFLTTFGRSKRETVCTCEVKIEPNLSQALHLLNGDTINKKISEGKVVADMLDAGMAPDDVIRSLYVRCLGRDPTAVEMDRFQGFLNSGRPRGEILDDLFWALLNSKEFLFNH